MSPIQGAGLEGFHCIGSMVRLTVSMKDVNSVMFDNVALGVNNRSFIILTSNLYYVCS